MGTVVLIRPGSTSFDDEGRLKGCLDFPLSSIGIDEVERSSDEISSALATTEELRQLEIIYCGPCESAEQTANVIARRYHARVRTVDCFTNINLGLWQGRTIEELRRTQPTLYRQFQANPLDFIPPGGESLRSAASRIQSMVAKLVRKHRSGTVGIVVSEPLASVVRYLIASIEIGDPWKAECDHANWEIISLSAAVPAMV